MFLYTNIRRTEFVFFSPIKMFSRRNASLALGQKARDYQPWFLLYINLINMRPEQQLGMFYIHPHILPLMLRRYLN